MTAVLIVEDMSLLADSVAEQLGTWHGFSVTCVRDPHAMRAELGRRTFDVVLIDLLFQHLDQEIEHRRRDGLIGLSSPCLLVTGLTAIQAVQEMSPDTPTVVWTAGEPNRRLHILYAYEELGQRVFCSKSAEAPHANSVAEAIAAAISRIPYVDPILSAYLPTRSAPSLRSTVLKDQVKRAIWRSVAFGAYTRRDIAKLTGYAPHYIGSQIPLMYDDLRVFDPGLPDSRQALNEIIRYAGDNWEFFLDEAVRRAYP
jgi:DNA-binding NarL/FixJ family response regulator